MGEISDLRQKNKRKEITISEKLEKKLKQKKSNMITNKLIIVRQAIGLQTADSYHYQL